MGVFSAFNEKRTRRRKSETPTVHAHYTALGRRAAVLRFGLLIFVVLFAVYSFSFHSSEITIENFRYMLKFVNLGSDADAPIGNLLTYDANDSNKGLIFKGDLAVLNESGLTITGWDGEVLCKSSFNFDHPKMVENGINLFCFDIGGRDIKVFNSYSQIWSPEKQFEYPILWLSASKSGGFAVVSSAKGYRSAVYVYDGEFRLLYSRLFGDKYVDFVDISPDGKEFITAAHYSNKGNLVTQVSRFRVDTENAISTMEFVGEVPLGIEYTDDGYCVMTSDALRMFGADDSATGEVRFDSGELLSGRVFGSRALVTYGLEGLSGGAEVVIYRPDGSVEYSKAFPTSLSDSIICGKRLFTLAPGVLTEINIETGEEKLHNIATSFSSLVADGDRLIIFSENRAEYF